MRKLSHENDFDLHENEPAGGNHLNGFALRLVLKQRYKRTLIIILTETYKLYKREHSYVKLANQTPGRWGWGSPPIWIGRRYSSSCSGV